MNRTNTFEIHPWSSDGWDCLWQWLDASASLWNAVNYERRQLFYDNAGESVWNADTAAIETKYKNVLGAATAQQITRANADVWRSFFKLEEKYYAGDLRDSPKPPGYWGNRENGRDLRTYIRHDTYTLQWGSRSRLDLPIGRKLKKQYGIGLNKRLRLKVSGRPKWEGSPGRLEIVYDEVEDVFRALQSIKIDGSHLDRPLNSHEAALDIGANNLVACSTTAGAQYLYGGRELFDRFRGTTEEIARLLAKLPEGQRSSKRIQRLYRQRTRQRDHAQRALARALVEQLHGDGVATVYVGDLADVLDTHWSVEVNEKTHNFWAFSQFIRRMRSVCEEYGLIMKTKSEAFTTQTCPECGVRGRPIRQGDALTCPCGFRGHADLVASETFLRRNSDQPVRPMARPVRFTWDDHSWSPSPCACPNE